MGGCISVLQAGDRRSALQQDAAAARCELQRLPPQVLAFILTLLEQRELLCVAPLVCKAWRVAALDATRRVSLDLGGAGQQPRVHALLGWLHAHGRQLQALQLSSSTPLGVGARLLRCLGGAGQQQQQQAPGRALALQSLSLQLDLDANDLTLLARHVVKRAPGLTSLKLQPVKPSLADLQLLVLACILGNIIGADAAGPVLPHLPASGGAVAELVAAASSLRSLSLARYELGGTACVAGGARLTSLSLCHCGLGDASLCGLARLSQLRHLVLADNQLSAACLSSLSGLSQLTHLDLSVMPSISRMRGAGKADLAPLAALPRLAALNVVGLGVSDASGLTRLPRLCRLEAGLNPLDARSLAVIGRLPRLQLLELGGISQAWVLSSLLPPPEALASRDASWASLNGLACVTHLDVGGVSFSAATWTRHMAPLLASCSHLQVLVLSHCQIEPPGKLAPLLGQLQGLAALNIDRMAAGDAELDALSGLTRLTRLSAASLSPKAGNRQAVLLARVAGLQSLTLRGNHVGSRGALALARGLPHLTSLDLADNRVGRRTQKQLGHLLAAAEAAAAAEDAAGPW